MNDDFAIDSLLGIEDLAKELSMKLNARIIESNDTSILATVGSKFWTRLLGYNTDRAMNRIPYDIKVQQKSEHQFQIILEFNPGPYLLKGITLYEDRVIRRKEEIKNIILLI